MSESRIISLKHAASHRELSRLELRQAAVAATEQAEKAHKMFVNADIGLNLMRIALMSGDEDAICGAIASAQPVQHFSAEVNAKLLERLKHEGKKLRAQVEDGELDTPEDAATTETEAPKPSLLILP